MKNMNQLERLENRLRSLMPRKPSAALRSRLFPQLTESRPGAGPLGPRMAGGGTAALDLEPITWHWLAPAFGLLLLTLIVLSSTPRSLTQFIVSPSTSLVATVALNQPNLASYYAGAIHSEHNAWPITTFDWTNGSHSLTTPPPLFKTNSLIP